jgi:hypothetical protein
VPFIGRGGSSPPPDTICNFCRVQARAWTRFCVENLAFLQDGIAPDDVVRFQPDEDGVLWATGRVQSSVHCVVRVLPVRSARWVRVRRLSTLRSPVSAWALRCSAPSCRSWLSTFLPMPISVRSGRCSTMESRGAGGTSRWVVGLTVGGAQRSPEGGLWARVGFCRRRRLRASQPRPPVMP